MTDALLMCGVHKAFGSTRALHDVSLSVSAGEYLTILGPSGSGKSSLLRAIAGFDRPDAGSIEVLGQDVAGLPAHQRGVGFVFQSFALFPHLTVADNVAFGLRFRQQNPVHDVAQRNREVDAALELVGLAGFGARDVAQISGGQRQRVALARCLVCKPRLILLDEPLGALDAGLRNQMTLELARIQRQLGSTFLHVTGNEQEALAMGSRVAVLDGGQLIQVDSPRQLFERPASPRVARLLNAYNSVAGRARAGRLEGAGFSVALPEAMHQLSGDAVCLVRSDLVEASPLGDGDGGEGGSAGAVCGRYVASEYAGSRVLALFDVGAEHPFEVEYQLGHIRPPEFTAGQRYALRWQPQHALAYAAHAS